MKIYKHVFDLPRLGHTYAIPNCINVTSFGVDPTGQLCCWYLHGDKAKPINVRLYFTGDDVEYDTIIIGTTLWNGLVWHLGDIEVDTQ